MLLRLARHRLFQTFIVLLIASAALATPIRHDYTFDQYPGVSCSKDCSSGNQTTTVAYGVPVVWLKLTKTVSLDDQHVVSQHREQLVKPLLLDGVSYVLMLAVYVAFTQKGKLKRYANSRH